CVLCDWLFSFFFFFFSSRRRHTRSKRDWSSDVVLFRSCCPPSLHSRVFPTCTSDGALHKSTCIKSTTHNFAKPRSKPCITNINRSEERRVGKECRSKW